MSRDFLFGRKLFSVDTVLALSSCFRAPRRHAERETEDACSGKSAFANLRRLLLAGSQKKPLRSSRHENSQLAV